jgi:UDP-N-acetylmuramyl pentapeptide phosphotransferase/UDP-N-acetylglucosamine-1-phosphate transferase
LLWLLLVTGGFLACGLLDDFFPLSAVVKLGLQLLVALFVFIPFLPADIRANLPLLGLICVALLYFVNAWNFMDGSNGMITVQALVIAVAVGTWPGQEAGLRLAALLLAGACAGFLPFNFPKARVFLGDSGSYLLGSAVFVLLLASCGAGVMTPVQALLLASVFLLDTALTLVRRLLRGRPFWRAHREHLFQFAVRKGHSHARVALAYAAATAVAWLLARCLWGHRSIIVTIAVPTLVWGGGAVAYVLLRRRWLRRKHRMEGQG